MDGQDGQRKSSPGNGQFAQQQHSTGLATAFDQNVSPTAAGQYAFVDGGSYMSNLQGQSFQSGDIGADYQSADLEEYRQRSLSNQTTSSLNSAFSPNFANQAYGNQSDGGLLLDPSLQSLGQQQGSINPADLMNNMSPSQEHASSPGGLSPASQRSPSIQQASFYSPNHSRHTSLDPSSAAAMGVPPPGQDWSGMMGGPAFSQHRRAPSEHSDISSIAPSPYVKQDGFDFEQGRSPMLNPQSDSGVYPENLGIDRFSISDPAQQGVSPGHSPIPSPRMSPHSGLGIPENQFILPSNDGNQFNGGPVFAGGQNPSAGMGGMAPPEINVEFAPSQNVDVARNGGDMDGLSPPDRGRRGARMRAHSDPSFVPITRPLSPGDTSPHLLSIDANQRRRSLSPLDSNGSVSRDLSPGGKGSRRSSTSSIPNREYILDLADPTRPTASGDGSGRQTRVQKHPATFQCTLCPKRFTRAYNLRSHLRTHTDERPFVCTVCGKAFARQHDRKRHEGLHSGEKKFVCRGDLAHGGGVWGCGRRFARADALGRHFRSEAGRVCIKPLLEEEAAERQRQYQEQVMASGQAAAVAGGMGLQPGTQTMDLGNGFSLPAALLAQYPALQGLQWDQLGAPNPGDDIDARSNFDASSGGEYYDDDDPNGGYVSGPGTAYSNAAW